MQRRLDLVKTALAFAGATPGPNSTRDSRVFRLPPESSSPSNIESDLSPENYHDFSVQWDKQGYF